MRVGSLIDNYTGLKALNYELLRKNNPKWNFEDESLLDVLEKVKPDISSIMDAPVGTGRFVRAYKKVVGNAKVFCIDYSDDMLKIASKRAGFFHRGNFSFLKKDLFHDSVGIKADLSVCYRFLNLMEWEMAKRALETILSATDKFSVFSIRTVDSGYRGDLFIEDKIHLHFKSDVLYSLAENGFAVRKEYLFDDDRSGQYSILFCERVNRVFSSRINHNSRSVYVYGGVKPLGKLYQAHNETHSKFIFDVTQLSPQREIFPKIKSIKGDFIDAEWIEGEPADSNDADKLVDLLVSIQSMPCDTDSGFDYVDDLVIPRFYRTHPFTGKDFCDDIVRLIRSGLQKGAMKISHPDVIPANVVRTPKGIVIVDNELLCRSRHHRVDILNLLKNIPADHRPAALKRYLELSNIALSDFFAEGDYLRALWLGREAGSIILKKGDWREVLEMVSLYRRGCNILPIDPEELT